MPDFDNIQISFVVPVSRVAGSHFGKVLSENSDLFTDAGILMPNAHIARRAILTATSQLRMRTSVSELRQTFFDTLLDGEKDIKRLVLYAPHMMGNAKKPFSKDALFPSTCSRLSEMNKIFGANNPDYFYCLRNPAGLITSLYLQSLVEGGTISFAEYIAHIDLNTLRWSARLEEVLPRLDRGCVHFWRFEDYPQVALPLFQQVTGLTNVTRLNGSMAPINQGMNAEGSERLWEYLCDQKRPISPNDQSIFNSLCAKFPSVDPMLDDYMLPRGLRENIQYRYDDDCYYLERLENAKFIGVKPVPKSRMLTQSYRFSFDVAEPD